MCSMWNFEEFVQFLKIEKKTIEFYHGFAYFERVEHLLA